MLTLAGRAEVVSLASLGLFLFPTLLLEKDPAVADQFLKGETMMVHQVEAATSELAAASTWCTIMVSPLRNWSAMARSFSRRRVGKRKRPREGRLTTSAPPARVSKTAVGHWARPRTGLHVHQLGQRQQQRLGAGGLLLEVLHQRAEHRKERRQLLQQVQREHVVCEEWVQC